MFCFNAINIFERILNMKRKIFITGAIFILIIAGCLFWFAAHRITPGNLSQIVVRDLDTQTSQTYKLNKEDAKNLIAGLEGSAADKQPDAGLKSFELTLKNTWGAKKTYTIYFDTANNAIYAENKNAKKLICVDNPAFFTGHEAFDGLYSYKKAPEIKWQIASDKYEQVPANRRWYFRRLNGNWYDSVVEDVSLVQTYTVNAAGRKISFNADYISDNVAVEIRDEQNNVVLSQESQSADIPIINVDGKYQYKIELQWNNPDNPYKGTYTYCFNLDVDLPVSFEITKEELIQGEVAKVYVYNANEGEKPFIRQNLSQKADFYKEGRSLVAYLPTGYYTTPGEYSIEYGIENGETYKKVIKVRSRDFHIQYLTVDEEIESSTHSDEANIEYAKYFTPVRQQSNNESYYTEEFIVPTKGRLSTEFGETRYVNGSPTYYHHSGLDIAADTGTPVYATNRGKVVLARHLIMTGNTIVIDHGCGLFSVYFHLDKLLVEQGAMAERGQLIGEVGSTGFSTGPHLHFTMSYFDTNIEPGYFIAGEPITYENYRQYLK